MFIIPENPSIFKTPINVISIPTITKKYIFIVVDWNFNIYGIMLAKIPKKYK